MSEIQSVLKELTERLTAETGAGVNAAGQASSSGFWVLMRINDANSAPIDLDAPSTRERLDKLLSAVAAESTKGMVTL